MEWLDIKESEGPPGFAFRRSFLRLGAGDGLLEPSAHIRDASPVVHRLTSWGASPVGRFLRAVGPRWTDRYSRYRILPQIAIPASSTNISTITTGASTASPTRFPNFAPPTRLPPEPACTSLHN